MKNWYCAKCELEFEVIEIKEHLEILDNVRHCPRCGGGVFFD